MKIVYFVALGIIILGCARVRVEAPKEPIKLDISMRLDVYQHVAKDIDQIEDIVSGSKAKPKNNQSLLNYFVASAYAQEALSPEVEQAALRRKERRQDLSSWQENGVIGENKSGLLEIRISTEADADLVKLIKEENIDRMVIYEAVAKKNGTPVEEVQKLYSKRLQKDAPTGASVEVLNEATGKYEWQIKP